MPASRRSVLAAGASLAAPPCAAAAGAGLEADIAALIWRSEASNAALMRGDLARHASLISYSDDFTFMGPFGGEPSRRADLTPERLEAMGRFFRNGTFAMEVVEAYGAPGLVVLALIERSHVEVGGLPAQDWALRVTLAYRRVGGEWRLAHRHADPLPGAISLEEAAALARR